eukprot:2936089-Amphidinium_carterae.1
MSCKGRQVLEAQENAKAQPERWKLVPLRSLDEPQASSEAVVYGFMLATRTYAALGGLYCHEAEGDHYHLVQHAGCMI